MKSSSYEIQVLNFFVLIIFIVSLTDSVLFETCWKAWIYLSCSFPSETVPTHPHQPTIRLNRNRHNRRQGWGGTRWEFFTHGRPKIHIFRTAADRNQPLSSPNVYYVNPNRSSKWLCCPSFNGYECKFMSFFLLSLPFWTS